MLRITPGLWRPIACCIRAWSCLQMHMGLRCLQVFWGLDPAPPPYFKLTARAPDHAGNLEESCWSPIWSGSGSPPWVCASTDAELSV